MKTELVLAFAAAVHGQTTPDPAEALSQARLKIGADMQRLPKYACVQTIDRSYFTRTPTAASCDMASADKKKGRVSLHLELTDRVRLDVAEDDNHEIHSWPGAGQFDGGDIEELINRGPVATGAFGAHLVDIFENDGAQFDFIGDKTEAGRHIFTFGYRVAEEMSHYKIHTDNDWAITAYDGTFEIDADSLELLRITVNTPEVAGETGLCEAQTSLEFARVNIGGGELLLPSLSQFHTIHRGSLETNSISAFTSCRGFQPLGAGVPDAKPNAESRRALPLKTELVLRLDADLDSDTVAAGDPVTATLVRDAHDPKLPENILIRAGAVAHGRISRMEHRLTGKPSFTFGIAWRSIEIPGVSWPLHVEIPPHLNPGQPVAAPGPGQPFDALLFETQAKRHVVKEGSVMTWVVIEAR